MPNVDITGMLTRLDAAIRAVCPIHGVAAGDPPRIDYRDEATAEQRAAAREVLRTFDRRPRRKRRLPAVARDLVAWINEKPDEAERRRRCNLVAVVGGAPGVLACPELAAALGIPVPHEEAEPA